MALASTLQKLISKRSACFPLKVVLRPTSLLLAVKMNDMQKAGTP